jgi:hypothetical protein
MEKIVTQILEKINKSWDSELKPKHGKSPQILAGDFIYKIISSSSREEMISKLELSEQVFNRTIKKLFPEVKLPGGNKNWSYYILSLIEYKKCFKCESTLPLTNFYKNIPHCKDCHTNKNIKYYNNRKDIWDTYYENNKSDYIARNAKRRADIIKATPSWANLTIIKDFYKNCPPGYHVDHIVPLKGINVCGLHVENNLQYLPADENLKKSNKF